MPSARTMRWLWAYSNSVHKRSRSGVALPFVSYGIALAKTAIVAWIFMELRARDGMQRVALAVGFVWALFLFVLLLADNLTRAWSP